MWFFVLFLALSTKVGCFVCSVGLLIFKKESEGDFRCGYFYSAIFLLLNGREWGWKIFQVDIFDII